MYGAGKSGSVSQSQWVTWDMIKGLWPAQVTWRAQTTDTHSALVDITIDIYVLASKNVSYS